ncbi:hypothetical protein B0H14DRAFT_2608170 [Mycena olivaceomarginata]|nr:hypothetical protein B0H14DRAFT_2608170 [Mycena olivaceomarginata]
MNGVIAPPDEDFVNERVTAGARAKTSKLESDLAVPQDAVMVAVKLNQKEQYSSKSRAEEACRKDIWGIQNEEAVWTSAAIRAWMGLKTECEQMKTKGVWTYGEMAQPRSHFIKERLINLSRSPSVDFGIAENHGNCLISHCSGPGRVKGSLTCVPTQLLPSFIQPSFIVDMQPNQSSESSSDWTTDSDTDSSHTNDPEFANADANAALESEWVTESDSDYSDSQSSGKQRRVIRGRRDSVNGNYFTSPSVHLNYLMQHILDVTNDGLESYEGDEYDSTNDFEEHEISEEDDPTGSLGSFHSHSPITRPTPEVTQSSPVQHGTKGFITGELPVSVCFKAGKQIQKICNRHHFQQEFLLCADEAMYGEKLNQIVQLYHSCIDPICIPKTILDAITVTHNLGIQYLWVDSYCIIQDSEMDKAKEINNMHQYFRDAYITIVAAGCERVSHGFLIQTEQQDPDFVPIPLPFPCPDGTWGTMLLQEDSLFIDTCGTNNHAWRKLTKKKDKLVAIGALASHFQSLWSHSTYVAGLWTHNFPHALLWTIFVAKPKPSLYRAPSWSWASVDGQIDVDLPTNTSATIAEELDHTIVLQYEANPYGAVCSATLVLKTSVVVAHWDKNKKVHPAISDDKDRFGSIIADFRGFTDLVGPEVTLAAIQRDFRDHESFVKGLVLIPATSTHDSHTRLYQRVGYFAAYGVQWPESLPMQEIHII